MTNLRKDLEEAETECGEMIEAMVVGKHYKFHWHNDSLNDDENVLLSREAGLAKVDQEYDSGYGGADCFPLWAWTKSRVYFVGEYDGSTRLTWVPRNPTAGEPEFSGQSL